jgi:hypothetical protein
MTKSTNLAIRLIAITAAIASGVFVYLLYGKVDLVMKQTSCLVKEGAGNDFDSRVNKIPSIVVALDASRAVVVERDGTIKDLMSDVADKKTRIEELGNNVTKLEGEKTDLTRKRDELTSSLATVTSERDSFSGQLSQTKEELAKKTEQIAAMFTKEQLDAEIASKNKTELVKEDVVRKYAALYNWSTGQMKGEKPPFPSNPTYVDNGSVRVEVGPETLKTRVISISPSQGLITFSVGQDSGIRAEQGFSMRVNEKDVGKISISLVDNSFCIAQIQPGSDLDALGRGQVVTLVPFTGKISAR